MDPVREYARLLVRTGVNLQKGQRLHISCEVSAASFAELCAEEAFLAGAGDVIMHWEDGFISRQHFLHASDEVFDEPDPYGEAWYQAMADRGDADLRIASDDPTALDGVDMQRVGRESRARRKAKKPVMDRMRAGRFQWCVGAYPTAAWAGQVFPELEEKEAVERLWAAVLEACKVNGDGLAAQRWAEEQRLFDGRTAKLNAFHFRKLRYKSGIGTDLTIGLPRGHFWAGGADTCDGLVYMPNIPTVEIFTSPHRMEADGTIAASLPLYLNGLVDGIRLTLKNGLIVEADAAVGKDILLESLGRDAGAGRLGECALVDADSPIRRTGILFRQTLFDENASCHFAWGNAYPMMAGAAEMTEEERLTAGLNVSDTHVDFMIGTDDLEVTGITEDGAEVPVMRNGHFVI